MFEPVESPQATEWREGSEKYIIELKRRWAK